MDINSDYSMQKQENIQLNIKQIMFLKEKANIITYKSAKTDGQDDHQIEHYEMTDT